MGLGPCICSLQRESLLVGVQVAAVGTVQFLEVSEVLAETQKNRITKGRIAEED